MHGALAAACVDEQADHPPAVSGSAILGPRGASDDLHERMLAIYEAAAEDPHRLR